MEILVKRSDFIKIMERYIKNEFGEEFKPVAVQFFSKGDNSAMVEVKHALVRYEKDEKKK